MDCMEAHMVMFLQGVLQLQGDDLISDSGCYSYVNKAEWLQPKECDSHNTMFIKD